MTLSLKMLRHDFVDELGAPAVEWETGSSMIEYLPTYLHAVLARK